MIIRSGAGFFLLSRDDLKRDPLSGRALNFRPGPEILENLSGPQIFRHSFCLDR